MSDFKTKTLDIEEAHSIVHCDDAAEVLHALKQCHISISHLIVGDGINFINVYRFGNMSILGEGGDTGEPFLYTYKISNQNGYFDTLDTSASHTISVKTAEEIVTPMAEEFLPTNTKNTTVFYL